MRATYICSFSNGTYTVRSPKGGQSLDFEDSDQFGPSKIDLRTTDLSPISERHKWFWEWYPRWREHGRPTVGERSTPHGAVLMASALIPAVPTLHPTTEPTGGPNGR